MYNFKVFKLTSEGHREGFYLPMGANLSIVKVISLVGIKRGGVHDLWMDGCLPPGFQKATLY